MHEPLLDLLECIVSKKKKVLSRKFVSTSQLGNLLSDVSVAYSYHHQGIMDKEALMHI